MDHWAFLTVELLVRKYKVMAGFPDGSFKGGAEVSRYELAAALTKVVSRMETLQAAGEPISVADVAVVKDVAVSFDAKPLVERADKLEASLKPIVDNKTLRPFSIAGGIGADFIDNTQDNAAPYMKTGFGVDIKTTVLTDVEVVASLGGELPAAAAGNKPATAGSDKPPAGKFNFGSAHATTHPAGGSLRFGIFEPKAFYGAGSELGGHWGGPVGNGFVGPDRNTTRWGDKNVAIAATREFGGLKASAAVTPVLVAAGLDWKLNDFLRFKLTGDSDQPDWGNLTNSNKASAHNVYGVADFGTSKLGLTLQGGLAKDLLQASVQVLWGPIGDYQVGLAAVYRSSDKGVTEVTPGVFLYLPAFAAWSPNITFGVKEPQVVATDKGNTGAGSLLGEQAGFSSVFEWKLEDRGFPNLTVEYNIQQPVLFYAIYDATFAISVGRGF
ncbi:MAG: porin [Cyanobacteria bacterium RYN_339]|nr:porin [Cyanobacteria bacterium RYN_339]